MYTTTIFHKISIFCLKISLCSDIEVHAFNPTIADTVADRSLETVLSLLYLLSSGYMAKPCLTQTKVSNKNSPFAFCLFISPDYKSWQSLMFLLCPQSQHFQNAICLDYADILQWHLSLSLFLRAHFLALNIIPLFRYTTLHLLKNIFNLSNLQNYA